MKILKYLDSGTYGHTIVIQHPDNPKKRCLLKVSKAVDFKIEHEYKILKALETLGSPFFCKPVALQKKHIRTSFLADGDGHPFSKTGTLMDICLMEYIPGGILFEDIISNCLKYPLELVMALVKQVIGALVIAQKYAKFTHYDLHTDNIMVKTCDPRTVFKIPMDSGDIYLPSYGFCIKIIDFGFSYIEKCCKDAPITTPLMFPNLGYTSNVFNPIADIKVFLVSVLYEIHMFRKHEPCQPFENIVNNMFTGTPINKENGWDNVIEHIAYDGMITSMNKVSRGMMNPNSIFINMDQECFDILQYGISLPLKSKPVDNIQIYWIAFLTEFQKFEEPMMGSTSKRLHLLKILVEASVRTRNENNQNSSDTIRVGVDYFKTLVQNECMQYKYLNLSPVHFGKCLASLILLTDCIEGVLYRDYCMCVAVTDFKYAVNAHQTMTILHHHYPSYFGDKIPVDAIIVG